MPSGRLGPLIALLAAAALAGLLAQPATRLEARTDDGRLLACRRVAPGDTVTLVFTHSMYGGEVRETWRVMGGGLLRERIVADRAAAAEYYATDGAVERVDGGFAVIAPPLAVDVLRVRVDHVGQHRLRFGPGDEVSLAAQVEGSVAATITPGYQPLAVQIISGCRG